MFFSAKKTNSYVIHVNHMKQLTHCLRFVCYERIFSVLRDVCVSSSLWKGSVLTHELLQRILERHFQYNFLFHSLCLSPLHPASPLPPGDGVVEVHNVARTAEGEFTDIVGTAIVLKPGVLYVEFAGCE